VSARREIGHTAAAAHPLGIRLAQLSLPFLGGVAKLVSSAKNVNMRKVSQPRVAEVSRKNRFHCYIFCGGLE
jgi:hypothetical protein